jgi:hypothetical protein
METETPTIKDPVPPRARRRVPRSVIVFGVGWTLMSVAALVLASDKLPFDRPAVAEQTVSAQVVSGWLNLLAGLLLVGITYLMTRRRQAPDLAGRAPARRMAAMELAALTGYTIAAMAVGHLLGNAIGAHPFGLHLPGALYGISDPPSVGWIGAWAAYNLIAYAVVPYLAFRRRGYTPTQLNMRSVNRRADAILILVILLVESALEIGTLGGPLLALDAGDAIRVIPLSFAVNFIGTVLPIAILVYGIALPRVLKVTGSVPVTAIIGGFVYAAMHVFDGWATYDSLNTGLLTLIFLTLQYFGPGLIKSVLTLRTGNVWVHVWGYHAIAPHATIDAPTLMHVFHGH